MRKFKKAFPIILGVLIIAGGYIGSAWELWSIGVAIGFSICMCILMLIFAVRVDTDDFCTGLFHRWNGCVCTRCGNKRDTEHTWDGCVCTRCGKKRDAEHTWDGCVCTRCGHKRNVEHSWDGCICTRCGAGKHDWFDGRCKHCDKYCPHIWERHDNSRVYVVDSYVSGGEFAHYEYFYVCSICGQTTRKE